LKAKGKKNRIFHTEGTENTEFGWKDEDLHPLIRALAEPSSFARIF
jgi:hypothetical protein